MGDETRLSLRHAGGVQSRAMISEFFGSGAKSYTPRQYVAAVRAVSDEAGADTSKAPAAADPETTVVPTSKRTALQWAWEQDTDDDDVIRMVGAGRSWREASVIADVTMVSAALVGAIRVNLWPRR